MLESADDGLLRGDFLQGLGHVRSEGAVFGEDGDLRIAEIGKLEIALEHANFFYRERRSGLWTDIDLETVDAGGAFFGFL